MREEVLHWLPEQDRWEPMDGIVAGVPGMGCTRQRSASVASPFDAGIHHFVVCIYGDEIDEIVFKMFDGPNGVGPMNVFPHKYIIDAEGVFENVDDGLTRTSARIIGV